MSTRESGGLLPRNHHLDTLIPLGMMVVGGVVIVQELEKTEQGATALSMFNEGNYSVGMNIVMRESMQVFNMYHSLSESTAEIGISELDSAYSRYVIISQRLAIKIEEVETANPVTENQVSELVSLEDERRLALVAFNEAYQNTANN